MGRRMVGEDIHGVGSGERAARFCVIRPCGVIVWVYVISGVCAALESVAIGGFARQAYLRMGDE